MGEIGWYWIITKPTPYNSYVENYCGNCPTKYVRVIKFKDNKRIGVRIVAKFAQWDWRRQILGETLYFNNLNLFKKILYIILSSNL